MPGAETRLVRESAENLRENYKPDAGPIAWIPLVGGIIGMGVSKGNPKIYVRKNP